MTSRVVVVGRLVDQDQVVNVGPGLAQLAADIAARSCDQDGPGLLFDQSGEQLVLEKVVRIIVVVFIVKVVVVVEVIVQIRIVEVVIRDRPRGHRLDRRSAARARLGRLGLVALVGIVVIRGMIGTHD